MRIRNAQLAILICALGALSESLFYTALAPLLPQLDADLALGHEAAGLLVAGYAIGYAVGAIPAYLLSARVGPRMTAVLGVGAVAVATSFFAFGDAYPELLAARVLVGLGSVVAYTGVLGAAAAIVGTERRGTAIGRVYSGSAAGSAIGPLVGSLAEHIGRGPVFAAVAAAQLLIAGLLSRLPSVPPTDRVPLREALGYLRSIDVRIGLWITSVPGFALGVLTLSGTYRLHEVGAGSTVIAIAFSGIAVINVFVAPRIGAASDRMGRHRPIALALLVAAVALILMALAALEVSTVALIAVAGAVLLAIGGPGLALVGDGIARMGGDARNATFLMNLAWGPSAAIGAVAAGLVHGARGAELSLILLAGVAVLSMLLVRRSAGPVT